MIKKRECIRSGYERRDKMSNCKIEKITQNGYLKEMKIQISLTGENSHNFILYPGEGYFSVGSIGVDEENIQAWVNKDDIIHWNVLDECNIAPWPRFLYYTGNDLSFVLWSQNRRIEEFTWKPLKKMKVDFSKSMIDQLYIHSNYELNLILGDKIRYLDLYGNPNNFIIDKCSTVPSLGFYPKKDKSLSMHVLPNYPCFKDATELLVKVDPNDAPFDCNSLLQFPKLELLHLIGNMTNLEVIKELKFLKKLGFWDVPNLSTLPSLDSWDSLDKFVAMNIDENSGKRLRKELSVLKKVRKFEYASISKLRNKLWFETEYGIPFSFWPYNNEKKATRAYKNCLKKVKMAVTEEDIKNAIIEFTNKINCLENIESVERDDTYKALCIIMKNSPIEIEHNKWYDWFDETRNF